MVANDNPRLHVYAGRFIGNLKLNDMKVICIDAANTVSNRLVEGAEYTVVQEDRTSYNTPVYLLFEEPHSGPYAQRRFIPLSSIDEKEFQREYNKELV